MSEDDETDLYDIYGFPKVKKEVPKSLADEWKAAGKCPSCGLKADFSHLQFYCFKCKEAF